MRGREKPHNLAKKGPSRGKGGGTTFRNAATGSQDTGPGDKRAESLHSRGVLFIAGLESGNALSLREKGRHISLSGEAQSTMSRGGGESRRRQ